MSGLSGPNTDLHSQSHFPRIYVPRNPPHISLLQMPHFYRYRVEEDYSPLRGRTPAPTPSTARRTTTTTTRDPVTADFSLLGLEANISVPAESDKTKVVAMFAQLDSAVRELREENKQLR